jgi:hypothetical protein
MRIEKIIETNRLFSCVFIYVQDKYTNKLHKKSLISEAFIIIGVENYFNPSTLAFTSSSEPSKT